MTPRRLVEILEVYRYSLGTPDDLRREVKRVLHSEGVRFTDQNAMLKIQSARYSMDVLVDPFRRQQLEASIAQASGTVVVATHRQLPWLRPSKTLLVAHLLGASC